MLPETVIVDNMWHTNTSLSFPTAILYKQLMCFHNHHAYSRIPSIHTFRLQRYACISSFFHAFLFITLSSSFTTDSTLVLSAPPPPSSLCLALFVVLNRDPVFISSEQVHILTHDIIIMRSSDTAIVAGHVVVAAGSADGRIHYDVVAVEVEIVG